MLKKIFLHKFRNKRKVFIFNFRGNLKDKPNSETKWHELVERP
jgi:hypothetical protein